ncbi:hypothetical protein MNBD_ALPHA04-775, partial [hydrothermal vent metagenome]
PVNARIAAISMLGVWAAYLLFLALRTIIVGQYSFAIAFPRMLFTVLISIAANWFLYRLLLLTRGGKIAPAVILLSFPTLIIALGIAYIDSVLAVPPVLAGAPGITYPNWPPFIDNAFICYLILVGWGGLYLALAHNRAVQIAMENSRKLEKLNRESELRALRYQLNPHFIFNALNSVSGLVMEKKNEQAEHLVDGLADYMRAVLDDDGAELISVEDEVAQQVRYLEIEQVRFPGRLNFEVHLDDAVRTWQIPALIIQPLVENAIKYGVARTTNPVRIIITANREAGRLKLSVANDGRMSLNDDRLTGTGTGLTNIRERLAVIYGNGAALIMANGKGNMVVASVIIPDAAQIFRDG